MEKIKYIIADDHKIFREGLRLVLSTDTAISCIGEAGNGRELLELLKQKQPDVILLDLKMPEMDGMEAIKRIKAAYPDIKVLILTMFDDEHFIIHLMELGAGGYLNKNENPEEIKIAIHTVYETGTYFNKLVSGAMHKKLLMLGKSSDIPLSHDAIKLNSKEIEVLKLICEEHTTTEIGGILHLSPRTVEGMRAALLEKIGVRNTAGLVLYAVKNGIINP